MKTVNTTPPAGLSIEPFQHEHADEVVALAIDVWTPVFRKTEAEVPAFVFHAFYPDGWATRQANDIRALLDDESVVVHVALIDDVIVGFEGTKIHPEDRMGEIAVLAVARSHQRQGIGRSLMRFAEESIRDSGMDMVMVETVGDSGHAPARRAYESVGFEPWPVARYFKAL